MIDTAGFYKYDGELLYAPNTVWLPDGQVLQRSDPPSEPVSGWQWFNTEDEARSAFGLPLPVRSRNPDGTYLADDPATPDVDEAWVET